jgi:hypothetical protein
VKSPGGFPFFSQPRTGLTFDNKSDRCSWGVSFELFDKLNFSLLSGGDLLLERERLPARRTFARNPSGLPFSAQLYYGIFRAEEVNHVVFALAQLHRHRFERVVVVELASGEVLTDFGGMAEMQTVFIDSDCNVVVFHFDLVARHHQLQMAQRRFRSRRQAVRCSSGFPSPEACGVLSPFFGTFEPVYT